MLGYRRILILGAHEIALAPPPVSGPRSLLYFYFC